MSAPGNYALIFALLALFVACSGYAAGRIHQRYRTDEDREEAYRHGYDTASRSVFSLAARIIAPRRSAARGSAKVKNALGEITTKSLRGADSAAAPTGSADSVAAGSRLPRGVSADLRSFARSAFGWGGSGGSAAPAPSEVRSGVASSEVRSGVAPGDLDPGRPNRGFARPAAGSEMHRSAGGSDIDRSAAGSDVDRSAAGSDVDRSAAGSDVDRSAAGSDVDRSVAAGPAAPSRAAAVRTAAGFGELGFPVPPPPSPRTVAEPAAVGGLVFQPFPEPRPVDDFSSVAAFADDGPDPADSPYAAAVTDEAEAHRPRVDSWLAARERADVGGRLSAEEVLRAAGRPVADHAGSAGPPAGGTTPADDRRSGAAGYRAFGGGSDPSDPVESAGGRHTVPDELVRAATYRLPADRVFRAKVPGAAQPPATADDAAAPSSVPEPRQS